jgi:hypothetical protein
MLRSKPMNVINELIERLAEDGVQSVVEVILVGLLTLGAGIIARNLVRRGKVQVGIDAGHTCMSPYVLLVGLLLAVVAAVFLVIGLAWPESLREPGEFNAWVGGVAGFSLGCLAILPFTRHTWQWDATGLRWHGAFRSTSMRWLEIVRLGKSWDGQFFAADKTGRKIHWSTYTLEHETLLRAIHKARPDLIPPA